jgi:hypothetical protein
VISSTSSESLVKLVSYSLYSADEEYSEEKLQALDLLENKLFLIGGRWKRSFLNESEAGLGLLVPVRTEAGVSRECSLSSFGKKFFGLLLWKKLVCFGASVGC